MTIDTSTESVERYTAFLESTGNKSGVALLHALAAERDELKQEIEDLGYEIRNANELAVMED